MAKKTARKKAKKTRTPAKSTRKKAAKKKTRKRKRGPLMEAVEKVEIKVITRFLKKHNWKKKPAAKELGVSRNTLSSKVKKYKLSPKKFPQL